MRIYSLVCVLVLGCRLNPALPEASRVMRIALPSAARGCERPAFEVLLSEGQQLFQSIHCSGDLQDDELQWSDALVALGWTVQFRGNVVASCAGNLFFLHLENRDLGYQADILSSAGPGCEYERTYYLRVQRTSGGVAAPWQRELPYEAMFMVPSFEEQ